MNGSNNDPRWLLWPDPAPDDKGYRACVVTENESGYQPVGKLSNSPTEQPPIYIGTTQEEAQQWCYEWNKSHFGCSKEEQDRIVRSSMRQKGLKVTYDGQRYGILLDGDEVLSMDYDECDNLMRQLYKLRWPYCPPECSSCGRLLKGFECVNETCPECPSYQGCPEDNEDSEIDNDESESENEVD